MTAAQAPVLAPGTATIPPSITLPRPTRPAGASASTSGRSPYG